MMPGMQALQQRGLQFGPQQISGLPGAAQTNGLDISALMNLMITMMIIVMMMKMMTGAMAGVGGSTKS